MPSETDPHWSLFALIGGSLFFLQQFAGINGVLYFSSLTFRDVGITSGALASLYVGITNFGGAIVASSLMDKQGRKKLLIGSYLGIKLAAFVSMCIISRGGGSTATGRGRRWLRAEGTRRGGERRDGGHTSIVGTAAAGEVERERADLGARRGPRWRQRPGLGGGGARRRRGRGGGGAAVVGLLGAGSAEGLGGALANSDKGAAKGLGGGEKR
ncbi:hypothetical protein ACP4OV_006329 [Aristida adscensionis]